MKNNNPLVKHTHKYKPDIWKEYTLEELYFWVHNLIKRSTHRTIPEKAKKDLTDAENYLWMLKQKIKSIPTDTITFDYYYDKYATEGKKLKEEKSKYTWDD